MSELARRLAVAVVGIPATVVLIYLGGAWLVALLAVLGGLGAWELFRLAERNELGPLAVLGVPLAAALPLYTWLATQGILQSPVTLAAVVFLALLAATLWARGSDQRPLASASVTACGAAYAGGTLSFALLLRHHRVVGDAAAGAALLLFPVALTWATDVGAYFVGRWLGGPKLMAAISPAKTVSGAVGGTIAAVAVSVAYSAVLLPRFSQLTLGLWTAIVFGLVISAVAQVGDLFESMLKRSAGVKDSSHLLPGHGGVLDRLDSLYFVLPVAHLLLNRLLVVAPDPR